MKHVDMLLAGLVVAAATLPALAIGPIDGEIGAVYWANEYDTRGGLASLASEDANAPGYRAEVWLFERYGLRAGVYTSDLEDVGMESSEYASVDLLWKAFAPSKNNFLAVGAGWQEMDLTAVGLDGETSGGRLSVEGRVSAGFVYFYGQGSFLPEMDDAESSTGTDGRFEELTGHEVEVGVSWKLLPFVSLRTGYRTHSMEFVRTDFDLLGSEIDGEVESSGFLAGVTIRF